MTSSFGNVLNNSRPPISVCMATYNGASFIREQLESILAQLNEHDTIIVVDDASMDATCNVICDIDDARIILRKNIHNLGHVRSFELAIKAAEGAYIILADQDDIWPENRLELLVSASSANSCLVIGGYKHFSREIENSRNDIIYYNFKSQKCTVLDLFLGRLPILGCVMCFPASDIRYVLPFPKFILAHDIYLFQYFLFFRRYLFLSELILYHRLHSNNVTPRKPRSMHKVIYSRLIMAVTFIFILTRNFFERRKSRY